MQLTLVPWQLVLLFVCVCIPLILFFTRWRQWELLARIAQARQADLESQIEVHRWWRESKASLRLRLRSWLQVRRCAVVAVDFLLLEREDEN